MRQRSAYPMPQISADISNENFAILGGHYQHGDKNSETLLMAAL
ncbi:hypothetical protein PS645_01981 [Pseudomonas fluorescens]|uniref:Uncharacterized protein n=1 Tax=Pseudomonas fluorescens TaxID=294 RepID=A0A5E6S3F0_PSEFL|nr:hypothetical protein PS645_01981 [Pseudomonas fluorescens]